MLMDTAKIENNALPDFTNLSSFDCDECNEAAFKVQRDAANYEHVFCEKCWNEHVVFCGNGGKPYGF